MKYIDDEGGLPTLELTRRNLETLLEKMDDPRSARTLIDSQRRIAVRAVENDEHYAAENRTPGLTYTNGVLK